MEGKFIFWGFRAGPKNEKGLKKIYKCLSLLIITTAITAIACSTAGATTYYVDPVNGDDSDLGTTVEPWRTMAKAIATVVAGDTVNLRSGNYGKVYLDSDAHEGTSWSNKILYQADTGATPVFLRIEIGNNSSGYYTEFDGITINPPYLDSGVYFRADVSNVRIRNLTIDGLVSWNRNENPSLADYGVQFVYAGKTGHYTDILIDGCEITRMSRGFLVNEITTDIVISNNEIHYLSSSGMIIDGTLGGNDLLVEGNHVYNQVSTGTGSDESHGSGIVIRQKNDIIIRGNIIHDFGNSYGIALYDPPPDGGHSNILIENNLIYDIWNYVQPVWIQEYSTGVVIRNNTIVGSHVEGYNGREWYMYPLKIAWPYGHQPGVYAVQLYNNVIVGCLWLNNDGAVDSATGNIMWSYEDHSVYKSELPGNIIVNPGNSSQPDYFESPGNFFVGSDDFTYELRHGLNLNDAFQLTADSPAVGFASPAYATDTDLLGHSRDDQPDAGCYEYTGVSIHYTISASTGEGGSINPTGQVSVNEGGSKTFTVTAYTGYHIDDVLVDGISQGAISSYSFTNVSSDHTISASFGVSPTHIITASADTGGSISPNGDVLVTEGDNQTFTVSPDSGYKISDVIVDAASQGAVSDYTFTNVNSDHTIQVTFDISDPNDAFVGYWEFDEATGSTAFDSSGSGRSGTLVNGPTWTAGRIGGALSFDGVNDYVEITDEQAFDFDSDFAVSAWVYSTTANQGDYAGVVSKTGDAGEGWTMQYDGSSEKLSFQCQTVSTWAVAVTNNVIPVNQWTYIVGQVRGTSVELYVNGTLQDITGTISQSRVQGNNPVNIGREQDDNVVFNGSIDDVRVYNRALSATEVQAIYDEAGGTPTTYTLDITSLNGSVSKNPDKTTYDAGEAVTLQATPVTGYHFTGWSGDVSGTSNPVIITMDANKSVTASFEQDPDNTAPTVTGLSPDDDAVQIPLNNLVQLHLVDNGSGVDAASVNITLNGDPIYTGDTASYQSATGKCYRLGSNNNYTFIYQADEMFDFDQQIQLAVSASDVAGNPVSQSWSFRTQMRSFGSNKSIAAEIGLDRQITATACDSSGNIWAVWQEGQTGSRNICLAKLVDGAGSFNHYVMLTSDSYDQCNADIAIGANGKLYVVWQGDNSGSWDIYISTSTNGSAWSAQRQVTDSDGDEVNPAVAVDGSANAYVVWEDDRNDNGDIYAAASDDDFVTSTLWAITSEQSEQSEPAIAVDAEDTVYIVWTDERQGSEDIYGASSDDGPWTNHPVVSRSYDQSSPALAAEDSGSKLHLLWVDDRGSDSDIYYAQTTDGIPPSPIDGENIVDDTTGSDQLSPAIAVIGSTGIGLCVFACWQDERNSDSDVYFAQVGSGSGTNIFVSDYGTNSDQGVPSMALDGNGYPYIVWTDDRNDNLDIFYVASNYIDPQTLAQEQVSAGSSAVVGPSLPQINGLDDVSVSIPAGACEHNVTVKISSMLNMPSFSQCVPVANYDVGPSGVTFDEPVTIIIPYDAVEYPDTLSPYYYEPQEDSPSQDGITAVHELEISSAIHAISFQTTHFSQFFLAAGTGTDEPNVTWRFGTYDDQKNAKVEITDGDDNPVVLVLRGAGYGEVIQDQDSVSIELHETTERTTLIMSAKNRKAGGTIGDITVNGSLKQISAKSIDLEGEITATGSLAKVIFNNVSDSIITVGSASNPRAALTLKFARVRDSNLTSQTPIRSLLAADWRDTDSTADRITAPSIRALKISGNRRNKVDGDFYADLVLTAATNSPLKAVISGDLIDSDWSVDGDIKTLVVKGASDNSRVCCTGNILTITLGAAYDSNFLAGVELDSGQGGPDEVSDFLTTTAQIKSVTVKGIKTQPGQYYFINSNVAAPSIGRVRLVNLKTQNSGNNFGICVMDTGAGNDLALVTNKSTIDSNDSFTVKQGEGIPGAIEDFYMEILQP